jgi:hypothetical protein
MPYILKLTNGLTLTTVPDGAVDSASTSINLVGKNVSGYGFFQNTNFLQMLENFSNDVAPDSPLKGQLWYDSQSSQLKVYDGSAFKIVGNDSVKSKVFSNEIERDTVLNSPEKGTIVLVENVSGESKFMGFLGPDQGWVSLN